MEAALRNYSILGFRYREDLNISRCDIRFRAYLLLLRFPPVKFFLRRSVCQDCDDLRGLQLAISFFKSGSVAKSSSAFFATSLLDRFSRRNNKSRDEPRERSRASATKWSISASVVAAATASARPLFVPNEYTSVSPGAIIPLPIGAFRYSSTRKVLASLTANSGTASARAILSLVRSR